MTMHTSPLPFQVSGGNALPQRSPAQPAANLDAGKAFGSTLSREIAQRQAAPKQAAPAPASAQSKPASADKPVPAQRNATREGTRDAARDATRDAAREPAKANGVSDKDAAAAAKTATMEESDDAEEAAAEAAVLPVTDMLAFMASLTRTARTDVQEGVAAGADAPGTADQQLTALQSAFARIGAQDGAGMMADAETLPSAASGGFALAAGVGQAPAELRAAQDGAAMSQAQAETGQFQAQLREASQQAATLEAAPEPAITQLQAQAAKLEAAQNPAAVPGDRIPARVGSQGWDNQISQRIVYMVGKEQAATLTLNPPDLGPVQVVLNVSNDQASVQFSSNQLEVRQALENAIPRLREMMSESGIALGNATVDAGMPDGRQASQDGERRANGHAGGTPGMGGDSGAGGPDAAPRTARTVTLGERGMVDTFA